MGANVTLLAANIRNDKLIMTGSGIYTPFSATYHHDTDSGYCHQETCFDSSHPETASTVSPLSVTFVSSMMYDPYTFVLLNETEGKLNVCYGTFCCHLQYRQLPQGTSKELYALGAFAGTHTVNGRFALQVCALVRCAGSEASSCGQEVEEAETKMDFLLEGKFGTRYVYPSVLASHMVLEQPEHLEKTADGRMTMKHSNMTGGLVTACLYGRMYHLGPMNELMYYMLFLIVIQNTNSCFL
uniref:Vanin C-terminal domain-containing protein n=1 Tax=Lates calcarifer TaxID=8187 RepID=A0A4W6EVK8_LATCA